LKCVNNELRPALKSRLFLLNKRNKKHCQRLAFLAKVVKITVLLYNTFRVTEEIRPKREDQRSTNEEV
jgi:hypothetical protein